MRIEITHLDKEFIVDYAQRFLEHKGVETSLKNQMGKGDPLQYDIKGYAGEFVMHKFFGVEMPDFDPHYTKRDMLLGFRDKRIVCDIKTTVYTVLLDGVWTKILSINDKIFQSNLQNKWIDAFIAVEIDKEVTYGDVLGIISWESLLKNKKMNTFSNGNKVPCVEITNLKPLSNEFKYIES